MTLLYCRAKRMKDISTVGTLESPSAKLPCGFHMLAKYQSVGAVNFVGDLAETQPTLSTCHFQPRPAADAAQAEPSDGLGRALEGGTYTAYRGAGQVWFCWLGGMGVGFGLSGKRSCVASLCPMCSLGRIDVGFCSGAGLRASKCQRSWWRVGFGRLGKMIAEPC